MRRGVALAALAALVAAAGAAAAAGPAPAQRGPAVGAPGGKRLVIDMTHAERVTYAGLGSPNLYTARNPQRQDVDAWANGLAARHGFAIETARERSPFTLEALDGVSAVAVLQPDTVGPGQGAFFADAEAAALRAWIERGGVLALVADPLITTSGGNFLVENFSLEPYQSWRVANDLLRKLGLDTHFRHDVVCSTKPDDKPDGTGDDDLNELYGSELPESGVALRVEPHGLFPHPGRRLGHWAGHTLDGGGVEVATLELGQESQGGGGPTDGADATVASWTVDRAAAQKPPPGGGDRAAGCEAPREKTSGRVAGVSLDRIGEGWIVSGGDLSLHAASYGSGAFYDNENFGMKPFWEAVLPALAGPGVRMRAEDSGPAAGQAGGSGATGTAPEQGTPAERGGAGRRGGRGSRGTGRDGSAGGERSGRGSGERGREALGGGSGSGGSGGASGAGGGAAGAAAPADAAAAQALSGARAGAGGADASAATGQVLPEPSDGPLTARTPVGAGTAGARALADAAEDVPGWLSVAAGAGALSALLAGFGAQWRRLRGAIG